LSQCIIEIKTLAEKAITDDFYWKLLKDYLIDIDDNRVLSDQSLCSLPGMSDVSILFLKKQDENVRLHWARHWCSIL
jgi:hypothetical protein